MRTVTHISDLHFGMEDDSFMPPLNDPHAALVGRGALAVEALEP